VTESSGRVKHVVATLFNVDESSLTPASSTEDIAGWDSMGQLMLILELEQEFEIQIPPERAEKLTNISAIISFVEQFT